MKNLISLLLGFVTSVFIICAAVTITLNCRSLYEADIENYNLTEVTGLSRSEILDNYQAMIDYNNIGGPDALEFSSFTMSDGGRIHFKEVRFIFHLIEYAMIVCGIITLFAIIFSIRKKMYSYRLSVGIFTMAFVAAPGMMAAFSWNDSFILFHRLMFSNDYWIFDSAADPVITILPDGYFLHCAIMIVSAAFAAAFFFLIWYFRSRKKIV